jgi:hypothetical protein
VGQQYSYMWRCSGTAVQLHVEIWWDSIIITCGDAVGQQYSYMWRCSGTAL